MQTHSYGSVKPTPRIPRQKHGCASALSSNNRTVATAARLTGHQNRKTLIDELRIANARLQRELADAFKE